MEVDSDIDGRSRSWREFYERQGDAVRREGGQIRCSEAPLVELVTRLAVERADDFHTILDVGCGSNLVVDDVLARMGKTVVGVDFTWGFLKLAPSDTAVTLVQGDAMRLPFADASFDAAICSETAEHVVDDLAVVRELARVVRPGGTLIFTVPNLWNADRIIRMARGLDFRIRMMEGHLREYSPSGVRALLSDWFEIEGEYSVGFGWAGSPVGGRIERLVVGGPLRRLTKSVSVVARRRGAS